MVQSFVREFRRSAALSESARWSVAGGVTSAVRAATRPVAPFFERGEGAHLWDVDGHRYVDFVLGYGPLLLGHNPPAVAAAVSGQVASMLSGGQHRLEPVVADAIREAIPNAGRVCFSSTGSEAVATALRIARAATGRSRIVKFEGHYHGWFDATSWNTPGLPPAGESGATLVPVPATRGIPDSCAPVVLRWNDADMLRGFLADGADDVACVILEPVPQVGLIAPDTAFLDAVMSGFRAAGALVVFDEVVTGFRLARGGAQEALGRDADLVVLAKALGGGMPISAVTGRDELMALVADGEVVHLGTFNGHAPSFAAANAALGAYAAPDFYSRLERLATRLETGLRDCSERYRSLRVRRAGATVWTSFGTEPAPRNYAELRRADGVAAARFAEELMTRGIHIQPRGLWMVSAAHDDDDIDEALAAVALALAAIDEPAGEKAT